MKLKKKLTQKIVETITKIKDKIIPKKKQQYEQVEGKTFDIQEGKVFIDKLELGDEDIIQIKIKTFKKIIGDMKND